MKCSQKKRLRWYFNLQRCKTRNNYSPLGRTETSRSSKKIYISPRELISINHRSVKRRSTIEATEKPDVSWNFYVKSTPTHPLGRTSYRAAVICSSGESERDNAGKDTFLFSRDSDFQCLHFFGGMVMQ